MEDIHDRIRGEGSFRKTLQTYDVLKGLIGKYPNFELGVNSVFCSMNEESMDDLVEYVRTMDAIKTHTVSLIRGTVADSRLKDIDIEKYKKVIHALAANLRSGQSNTYRFKGARLKAAQDIIQRDVIYKTLTQKKQIVPCYAGKLNLVLTETGDVFPCESFDKKMGNVRESAYDMKEILEGSDARRIMQMIQDNNCYCTHECYLMTNILFNPRIYPELIKEYARLL
jgi:radical SAM protein with 4Fe4S-binding SPASM domain